MAHEIPQVPGVDHRFVRVGDYRFHVAESGAGEPVLLLHGWPQHWYAWRLVIPRLAETHRVLAMDLRGFGWSDIAWEGFGKEAMARDAAAVLEKLGIEHARVAGHDWGGWIGFLLARRRPDLVESLVALSVPPPWSARAALNPTRLRHQFLVARPRGQRALRKSRFAAQTIRRWAAGDDHLPPEALGIYARDLRASTRARAGSLLHRTYLARELVPVLAGRYRRGRPATPTLLMLGERDPTVSLRHARGVDVEVVPGAGHFLPEEAPDLVADRIAASPD